VYFNRRQDLQSAFTTGTADWACGDLWLLLGCAANATLGRQILEKFFVAHSTKCGTGVADNVGFCPSCGASQEAGVAPTMAPAANTQSGLSENVAGLLCYLLLWVTGLIFYLTDKRPFVRFHAAQSIVVFGGLTVISKLISMFFIPAGLAGFSMGVGLLSFVSLVGFVLWILLMVKAYQGEKFRIPLAADLADQIFGKS
jgi:uncharacterized membrane protein